jgi:hypothetical protein
MKAEDSGWSTETRLRLEHRDETAVGTQRRDCGWNTETAPELKSQAEYGEWLFGSRRGYNGLEEKQTWSAMRAVKWHVEIQI